MKGKDQSDKAAVLNTEMREGISLKKQHLRRDRDKLGKPSMLSLHQPKLHQALRPPTYWLISEPFLGWIQWVEPKSQPSTLLWSISPGQRQWVRTYLSPGNTYPRRIKNYSGVVRGNACNPESGIIDTRFSYLLVAWPWISYLTSLWPL